MWLSDPIYISLLKILIDENIRSQCLAPPFIIFMDVMAHTDIMVVILGTPSENENTNAAVQNKNFSALLDPLL